MHLKRLALAIFCTLSASLTSAQDKPRVVAVNYPLQYLAERLLGDSADVVFPVPEGVDPSFWRPSISDISMIQSADLILLNGAGFATWIDRVSLPRSRLLNTSASFKDQYIVTESITHSHGDGGEHSHEGLASYTWLDPTLALRQAEVIAGAITARGLASEEDVAARLSDLRADLDALDAMARESLANLQDAELIATHPRYQYLARRYGLSIASLEWEAGETPNADQLNDLQSILGDTGARILIWEAQPDPAAIEAVAALGAQSAIFAPLAHPPGDTTFLEAFEASVEALAAVPSN